MTEWYEYDIKERVKNVYSKHSLKDFWGWWSDGDDEEYMEIRVKNESEMYTFAKQHHFLYNKSGVFINKYWQLEKIIKRFRGNSTMWFGLNPRRKLPNRNGKKIIQGKDINISRIKFLFIDIDRRRKEGVATTKDLMSADMLSNEIITKMSTEGFANNYMKLCSGNGVQLTFKLDVPFEIPYPDYLQDVGEYVEDSIFKKIKNTLKTGIGKILENYSKHFSEEYNVEIDSTGFNMNRVGALPTTYNFKHDKMIPRGIIRLETGVNNGLSDYLLQLRDSNDYVKQTKKEFDNDKKLLLSKEYVVKNNTIKRNVIIRLMRHHYFPDGGINNTLWYALKILLHANGITTSDSEYVLIHEQLKKIHDRGFTDNGLEQQYRNNYNGPFKKDDIKKVPFIVNKYLRLHKIISIDTGEEFYHKPLFPISPFGKTKKELILQCDVEPCYNNDYDDIELTSETIDPLKDIIEFNKYLNSVRRGDFVNDEHVYKPYNLTDTGVILTVNIMNDVYGMFLYKYVKKWGLEITLYMKQHYMDDVLNYKRW